MTLALITAGISILFGFMFFFLLSPYAGEKDISNPFMEEE